VTLPIPVAVFPEVSSVRRWRLLGLDGPGIARKTGLTERRVKHLEQQYPAAGQDARPLVRFITPGLCRDVREAWALGSTKTRAALAADFNLTLDQVAEVFSRPFPYLPAAWGCK
jgi:hypothetical protein